MNAEQLYEALKKIQEPKGYYFNADMSMTLPLMESLLVNKERFGYMACPCRLANGTFEADRDIVCRIIAKGKNPALSTAQDAMTQPVISVSEDTTLADVLAAMEDHQVRRLPVVDANGNCCGIISQADVALAGKDSEVGEMVREVSREAVAS